MSIDKLKLYSKLKKSSPLNTKDNKSNLDKNISFQIELTKKFEKKEKKYISFYQNHFEENDIKYLEETEQMFYYENYLKKIKSGGNNLSNLFGNNSNNLNNEILYNETIIKKILALPMFLIFEIFSYLNIFLIGKIGLTNKKFYELIYKKFPFFD